jgi:hypothetical protein
VDLNHRPRPYQGLLWCYMHSNILAKPGLIDVVVQLYVSKRSNPAIENNGTFIENRYDGAFERDKKSRVLAQFVGKRAVEKDASRKSPKARLSHSAWKSRKSSAISTFPTAPATTNHLVGLSHSGVFGRTRRDFFVLTRLRSSGLTLTRISAALACATSPC